MSNQVILSVFFIKICSNTAFVGADGQAPSLSEHAEGLAMSHCDFLPISLPLYSEVGA